MEADNLSKKLIRQIKRYLKIDHFLKDSSLEISSENHEDLITISKNLPAFLEAIDKSYDDYEDRIKMALRNLEISSSELNDANQVMEKLNTSVNAMLDSLGQGLLFFREDGIVSSIFSKSCLEIFRTSPSGKHLSELLNLNAEESEDLKLWLSIVFDDTSAMGFDDMEELAPTYFQNDTGSYIGLQYRPMYIQEKSLDSILLIATDLTEKLAAEQKIEQMQEEAELVLSITNNKSNYIRFMNDLKKYLEGFDLKESSIEALRKLHTYKGTAMTFRLSKLADGLHNLELIIKNKGEQKDLIEIQVTEVLSRLKETNKECHKLLDIDALKTNTTLEIEHQKLETFMSLIKSEIKDQEIRDNLIGHIEEKIISKPIKDHLRPLENEIIRIAISQNKKQPNIVFKNCDTQINFEKYNDLFDSFIHLARNIADHGIEQAHVRESKGKKAGAEISIELDTSDPQSFLLIISDDGAGIDPKVIREKLSNMGIDTSKETDQEVINHILDGAFSTKENTSKISGQGIGMSSLKDSVEKLDGNIKVESTPDKGTTFLIKWPK